MRFLLVLAALALMTAQPTFALTVCPTSQFVLTFEPDSTTLTGAARETLGAAYNRARQCERPVFTLLANGRDPLGRERVELLRSELIALGLSAATPIQIGIDEGSPDNASPPNYVMAFVEYDY